jgi:tripartite-type tricarboxylate transporter receptor subunit TctC
MLNFQNAMSYKLVNVLGVPCIAIAVCFASVGFAQDNANKPVKLIVSLSTGTALDRAARWTADWLEKETSRTTVVENRPGASGLIATEHVMRAPPDGSMLLFGGSTMSLSAALVNSRAPNPATALRPVARLSIQPIVLVTGKAHQFTSVQALIAHAKATPKPLTYATGGVGSPGHFSATIFARHVGIELVHIPYPTASALNRDVISGQVDLSFNVLPSVDPHLKNGQLRALAVTGERRSAALPELPTLTELGFGDEYPVSWYGVFAPPATPPEMAMRLGADLRRAMEQSQNRATLASAGIAIDFLDSEQFRRAILKEMARAADIARRENIGVE